MIFSDGVAVWVGVAVGVEVLVGMGVFVGVGGAGVGVSMAGGGVMFVVQALTPTDTHRKMIQMNRKRLNGILHLSLQIANETNGFQR